MKEQLTIGAPCFFRAGLLDPDKRWAVEELAVPLINMSGATQMFGLWFPCTDFDIQNPIV